MLHRHAWASRGSFTHGRSVGGRPSRGSVRNAFGTPKHDGPRSTARAPPENARKGVRECLQCCRVPGCNPPGTPQAPAQPFDSGVLGGIGQVPIAERRLAEEAVPRDVVHVAAQPEHRGRVVDQRRDERGPRRLPGPAHVRPGDPGREAEGRLRGSAGPAGEPRGEPVRGEQRRGVENSEDPEEDLEGSGELVDVRGRYRERAVLSEAEGVGERAGVGVGVGFDDGDDVERRSELRERDERRAGAVLLGGAGAGGELGHGQLPVGGERAGGGRGG